MERNRPFHLSRNAKNLNGATVEAKPKRTKANKNQNENVKAKPPWAHLPDSLIELISSRLYAHDLSSFRRVCKAWRAASATQCLCDPQLVISYQSKENAPYMISVTQSKWFNINMQEFDQRHCVGSAYGWLIMRKNNSYELSLLNLFTGSMLRLPPLTSRLEAARFYLSSPPTSPDCIVLGIGLSSRCYAFCKLGDKKWNYKYYLHPSWDKVDYYFDQAVALQGKFYALSHGRKLVTIEDVDNAQFVFSSSAIQAVIPREYPSASFRPFLVEAQGEILVVLLWIYSGSSKYVEMFRMDFPSASWVKMESLGDRVLFLGYNCSFCVAAGLLNLRGNRIYIANHTVEPWIVFDMETKRFLQYTVDCWPHSDKNNRIWVLPTFI